MSSFLEQNLSYFTYITTMTPVIDRLFPISNSFIRKLQKGKKRHHLPGVVNPTKEAGDEIFEGIMQYQYFSLFLNLI